MNNSHEYSRVGTGVPAYWRTGVPARCAQGRIIGIYVAVCDAPRACSARRKILWSESLNIDGFMNALKIMTGSSHRQLY